MPLHHPHQLLGLLACTPIALHSLALLAATTGLLHALRHPTTTRPENLHEHRKP
ncbi:hypothetical protein [Nocardia sp. NPDC046763]|uniref:hypothetical protein n=1 Tax=Nocardia sp. NPDC046763 TaxID=3155256 RepID=UPI0033DF3DF8